MKKVITTVGTSIFSNCLQQSEKIRPHYSALEKAPGSEWNRQQDRIEKLRQDVIEWAKDKVQASAELKSTAAMASQMSEDLEIHLIATDTVLSRLAAEIIVKLLIDRYASGKITASFDKREDAIHGLQVDDAGAFCREGLVNLIQRIEDICGGYYAGTIFNITGGYKAVIPYLTILAQVNNASLYYIFEDTETLIRIPQTPVDINWGLFEKYKAQIEEMSRGLSDRTWDEYRRTNGIEDDFPDIVWSDDQIGLELNAIGQYFYRRYCRWSLVYVISGGPFSSDQAHRFRPRLNRAIEGLHSGLHRFIRDNRLEGRPQEAVLAALHERGGANLNHATPKDAEYFIYKYPSSAEEIRLLYGFEWENGGMRRLTVYDYRAGEFNHKTYPREFHCFYINNRDKQSVPYLQTSYK